MSRKRLNSENIPGTGFEIMELMVFLILVQVWLERIYGISPHVVQNQNPKSVTERFFVSIAILK